MSAIGHDYIMGRVEKLKRDLAEVEPEGKIPPSLIMKIWSHESALTLIPLTELNITEFKEIKEVVDSIIELAENRLGPEDAGVLKGLSGKMYLNISSNLELMKKEGRDIDDAFLSSLKEPFARENQPELDERAGRIIKQFIKKQPPGWFLFLVSLINPTWLPYLTRREKRALGCAQSLTFNEDDRFTPQTLKVIEKHCQQLNSLTINCPVEDSLKEAIRAQLKGIGIEFGT